MSLSCEASTLLCLLYHPLHHLYQLKHQFWLKNQHWCRYNGWKNHSVICTGRVQWKESRPRPPPRSTAGDTEPKRPLGVSRDPLYKAGRAENLLGCSCLGLGHCAWSRRKHYCRYRTRPRPVGRKPLSRQPSGQVREASSHWDSVMGHCQTSVGVHVIVQVLPSPPPAAGNQTMNRKQQSPGKEAFLLGAPPVLANPLTHASCKAGSAEDPDAVFQPCSAL